MLSRRCLTQFCAAVAVLSALALSACGSDGVQLEGKLFDWMGVSASSQEGRTRDPKMADRAPLVVPPNVNRLPEPGSGQTSSQDIAALNDPELRKQAVARERERQHMAYCRGEIQWKEKVLNPQDGKANRSPYGPCPGLFSGATTNINVNK